MRGSEGPWVSTTSASTGAHASNSCPAVLNRTVEAATHLNMRKAMPVTNGKMPYFEQSLRANHQRQKEMLIQRPERVYRRYEMSTHCCQKMPVHTLLVLWWRCDQNSRGSNIKVTCT